MVECGQDVDIDINGNSTKYLENVNLTYFYGIFGSLKALLICGTFQLTIAFCRTIVFEHCETFLLNIVKKMLFILTSWKFCHQFFYLLCAILMNRNFFFSSEDIELRANRTPFEGNSKKSATCSTPAVFTRHYTFSLSLVLINATMI